MCVHCGSGQRFVVCARCATAPCRRAAPRSGAAFPALLTALTAHLVLLWRQGHPAAGQDAQGLELQPGGQARAQLRERGDRLGQRQAGAPCAARANPRRRRRSPAAGHSGHSFCGGQPPSAKSTVRVARQRTSHKAAHLCSVRTFPSTCMAARRRLRRRRRYVLLAVHDHPASAHASTVLAHYTRILDFCSCPALTTTAWERAAARSLPGAALRQQARQVRAPRAPSTAASQWPRA